jgi:exopolysaccharide production protein ExoZ
MIRPIQYLRALAALMVVWHHSLGQVPGVARFITLPEFGPAGVDLFFVISGFIMLVTTAGKEVTPGEFFRQRILRVAPLYWLVTLLMIGCAIIEPSAFKTLQFSGAAVLKSLLFIPYDSLSFPGETLPLLVPGWSLNYEMFFYALFAVSLLMPTRFRLASLVATLGALVLAGHFVEPMSPILSTYTNPRLLEFAAGAAIAYVWIRGMLRAPLIVSVAAIVTGACLLAMAGLSPIGAVLIVSGCLNPILCEPESRALLALGDASYSIYLTHLFTLGALRIAWVRLVPHESLGAAIAFMVVALAVCAAAGRLCYRFVERPLNSQLREMAKRRVDALGIEPAT